jgi:hypothetical protein
MMSKQKNHETMRKSEVQCKKGKWQKRKISEIEERERQRGKKKTEVKRRILLVARKARHARLLPALRPASPRARAPVWWCRE